MNRRYVMTRKRSLWLLVAAGVLGVAVEAHAIIGRPLTPVSFAGVARRSVRRTAYAAPMVGAAAVGAATVGAAAAYSTLPVGCTAYAPCGGVTYAPVYNGPEVVYVPR
ncbi:MAG: hypothetical protein ACXVDD_19160 [Polyangia bacterium]